MAWDFGFEKSIGTAAFFVSGKSIATGFSLGELAVCDWTAHFPEQIANCWKSIEKRRGPSRQRIISRQSDLGKPV